MYADGILIRKAMKLGAKAYVTKSAVADEMMHAIRTVESGGTFISESLRHMSSVFADARTNASPLAVLTAREIEVLRLIADGSPNKAIASNLRISSKTVEKHRASIMDKLGIRDVANLVRIAIRHGIADLDLPGR